MMRTGATEYFDRLTPVKADRSKTMPNQSNGIGIPGGGKCQCCPYGYHIDLDFVRYCKDVTKGSKNDSATLRQLKQLKRAHRRQTQSMDTLLGVSPSSSVIDVSQNIFAIEKNENEIYKPSPPAPPPRKQSLGLISPPAPPPDIIRGARGDHDLQVAMMDFEEALESTVRNDRSVKYSPESLDLLHNTDHWTQVRGGVNYGVGSGTTLPNNRRGSSVSRSHSLPRHYVPTSSPLSQPGPHSSRTLPIYGLPSQESCTMAALDAARGMAIPQDDIMSITSGVSGVSTTTLQSIREQMAEGLDRLKDLEEEVKIIPRLQIEVGLLREQRRLLLQQLANNGLDTGLDLGFLDDPMQGTRVNLKDFQSHRRGSGFPHHEHHESRPNAFHGELIPRLFIDEGKPTSHDQSTNKEFKTDQDFKSKKFDEKLSKGRLFGEKSTDCKTLEKCYRDVGTSCHTLTRDVGTSHVPHRTRSVAVSVDLPLAGAGPRESPNRELVTERKSPIRDVMDVGNNPLLRSLGAKSPMVCRMTGRASLDKPPVLTFDNSTNTDCAPLTKSQRVGTDLRAEQVVGPQELQSLLDQLQDKWNNKVVAEGEKWKKRKEQDEEVWKKKIDQAEEKWKRKYELDEEKFKKRGLLDEENWQKKIEFDEKEKWKKKSEVDEEKWKKRAEQDEEKWNKKTERLVKQENEKWSKKMEELNVNKKQLINKGIQVGSLWNNDMEGSNTKNELKMEIDSEKIIKDARRRWEIEERDAIHQFEMKHMIHQDEANKVLQKAHEDWKNETKNLINLEEVEELIKNAKQQWQNEIEHLVHPEEVQRTIQEAQDEWENDVKDLIHHDEVVTLIKKEKKEWENEIKHLIHPDEVKRTIQKSRDEWKKETKHLIHPDEIEISIEKAKKKWDGDLERIKLEETKKNRGKYINRSSQTNIKSNTLNVATMTSTIPTRTVAVGSFDRDTKAIGTQTVPSFNQFESAALATVKTAESTPIGTPEIERRPFGSSGVRVCDKCNDAITSLAKDIVVGGSSPLQTKPPTSQSATVVIPQALSKIPRRVSGAEDLSTNIPVAAIPRFTTKTSDIKKERTLYQLNEDNNSTDYNNQGIATKKVTSDVIDSAVHVKCLEEKVPRKETVDSSPRFGLNKNLSSSSLEPDFNIKSLSLTSSEGLKRTIQTPRIDEESDLLENPTGTKNEPVNYRLSSKPDVICGTFHSGHSIKTDKDIDLSRSSLFGEKKVTNIPQFDTTSITLDRTDLSPKKGNITTKIPYRRQDTYTKLEEAINNQMGTDHSLPENPLDGSLEPVILGHDEITSTSSMISDSEVDDDVDDDDDEDDDSFDIGVGGVTPKSGISVVSATITRPTGETERKKAQPSRGMKAALKVFNDSLGKSVRSGQQLNNATNIIQREWLTVSGQRDSDPLAVEDYLDALETDIYSPRLLPRVVNLQDHSGNTAMHYAVSHANFDCVSVLLDSKVCNINQQNKAGYTAVMLVSLAAIQGETHACVVQRLFHLADVNIKASQHGQTALMLAVSHGRLDMVQLLVTAGADINVQDDDGSTALMCAAEHGHLPIVQYLAMHQDTRLQLQDHDGSTALTIAVEAGHKDVGVLLYKQMNLYSTQSPKSKPRRTNHHVPPRASAPSSPHRSRKSSGTSSPATASRLGSSSLSNLNL